MVKSILGVVVGYIVFMLLVFVLMTLLYAAVGIEQVFKSGTFQITLLWTALAFIVSLLGGMAGGYVCSILAGSGRAVLVLAAIVFVLGILMCIPVMTADKTPRPRPADLQMMQAMNQAQAPVWMHLLTSVLAGAGVWLGRRRKEGLPAAG